MKKINTVIIIMLAIGLSFTTKVTAQEAMNPGSGIEDDRGTIRGTVLDKNSGEPIFGVTVFIEETSDGTSTDLDGKFDIRIEPGVYNIKFTYVSYSPLLVEGVEVKEGEVTSLGDILISSSVKEMDELVVSADRINNSELAMISMKRKSPNVMDGITAQRFNEIGDSDAAEALKRVTGVSVEGGKYVYVRGLGDRYTKTMMNKVDIPSLDPDKNSIQIDIFPTNLIDNMVISKSAVAHMPADFTGGIVNIETKDFPNVPIMDVSVSVGYNPSMHFNNQFLDYGGSGTDFLGFDDGTRSLPEGARSSTIPTPVSGDSPEQVNNFVNSFNQTLGPTQETNLMDYSLSVTMGNQFDVFGNKKLGYIFTGSYKNSNNHYSDIQYGEYQTQVGAENYELVYATTQDGVLSSRNILVSGLAGIAFKTDKSKYRLTAMHLQNGESSAGNFFIDNSPDAPGQSGYTADSYNLDYSERSITNFFIGGLHYLEEARLEIDWRIAPTFSSINDPDIRKTAYTLSLADNPPKFSAGAGGNPSRLWRNMDEVNYSGRLDLNKDYTLFSGDAKVRLGASYSYKERDFEIFAFDLQSFGSWPALTGDPDEVLREDNIYPNGNVYYQSGNPDPNPNQYTSNVNYASAYISNEFVLTPKLRTYLGLRVENYVQRHTGRDALFAQSGTSGNNLDNAKVLDSTDFFPSVNFTYDMTDNMSLRTSYSRTIARPTFKELSFAQILDPVSDRIFNGGLFSIGEWDGNLTETRIDNFDIRWERFGNNGQLLSLSGFYKTFDRPIEVVRIQVQVTSSEFQPRNVGDGEVFGAELEFRKNLDFLGTAFRWFSFNGNFTYVLSEIDLTEQEFNARKSREKTGETVTDSRQMAGQAPYIINAGLQYDNPEIGLDAGFFYNVNGETLVVVGGGLFPDVYSDPYHNLRFNLNKKLGDKASVNLSVSNILNDSIDEVYKAFRAEESNLQQLKSRPFVQPRYQVLLLIIG
ncbi:TonB-dependent receptor [Rhodohalobacter sp.]|uniref:TonB-dependent receptor n=1 Tax=Rhodohalobacter sp. TaxID=1974210 RepID=UPI002ACEF1BF|nr:TonB-dependent receptor [Rhodohalobacter sp.]MDZ7758024.1 TonB-dependent receptor [Rhodohalobacter sp.]